MGHWIHTFVGMTEIGSGNGRSLNRMKMKDIKEVMKLPHRLNPRNDRGIKTNNIYLQMGKIPS